MNVLELSAQDLRREMEESRLTVAVVGLGHVGMPLAAHVAGRGARVLGVVRRRGHAEKTNRGEAEFYEPGLDGLMRKVAGRNLTATLDLAKAVREADVVFITVGTPVDPEEGPVMKDVLDVAEAVGKSLRRGTLVVLRSTVPPRTTEETVMPSLESFSSLKCEEDFGLAFCPERLVEGRALEELRTVPEVVGGVGPKSTEAAANFFEALGSPVVRAASPRVAEMAKIFDNVYRDVNIALANELALVCERLGVDIMQVREVGNTGPRTRLLVPGAGVGGSCLNKDPVMLAYLARQSGFQAALVETARERNLSMPRHMIQLVKSAYSEMKKEIKGSRVAVLGLAFKDETDDVRNSVAHPIIVQLQALGAVVAVNDPYVKPEKARGMFKGVHIAKELPEALRGADCLVIVTDHRQFRDLGLSDIKGLVSHPAAIVDGRHVFNPSQVVGEGLVYRGVGRAT